MEFAPCTLCDIINGMPTPGGYLIERETWCAVHMPPPRSIPRGIVLFPRRHVRSLEELERSERNDVLLIQADVRALMAAAFDEDVRLMQADMLLGHLAWLAWPASGPEVEDVESRFIPCLETEVANWAAPLMIASAEVALLAHGGKLPLPARLPGESREVTSTERPAARFCTCCGNRLRVQDHRNAHCRTCGTRIPP